MEYLIVSFRSRSSTVKFSEILLRNNIPCEIVNTPKEVGIGCGLSAKISQKHVMIAKKIVKMASLSSFVGVFSVKTLGGRTHIKSI